MFGKMFLSEEEKAKLIYEGLSKKENIDNVDCCSTRLRIEVNNLDKVNRAKILESGAKDVIITGETSVQIVIGPKVEVIMEKLNSLMK